MKRVTMVPFPQAAAAAAAAKGPCSGTPRLLLRYCCTLCVFRASLLSRR